MKLPPLGFISMVPLGGQVWRIPSLLEPRADVAESLQRPWALPAMWRAMQREVGREAQARLSPDGGIWAAGGKSSESPAMRPTSPRDGNHLRILRRKLNAANAILHLDPITIDDYRRLIALLDSIPAAQDLDAAKLSDDAWKHLILEASLMLTMGVTRGLQIGYNDFSLVDRWLQRGWVNIEMLQGKKPGESDWPGSVWNRRDQKTAENVNLTQAWKKLPWWARVLMRRNYRGIRRWENSTVFELAAKLMNDYHRRSDFFRTALGLTALRIVMKQDMGLNIVRMTVLGKEFKVDQEREPILLRGGTGAPVLWDPAYVPRGVFIYARGAIGVRPGN